jgi:uncharacterized integral membrane protein
MSSPDSRRVTPDAEHMTEVVPPAPPAEKVAPGNLIPPPRHARTGTTWLRVGAAVLIAVVLIIFAVQNTRGVEISFLWMTTSTPLALALLIGAVGGTVLTLVLSTARITRLRREIRRDGRRT